MSLRAMATAQKLRSPLLQKQNFIFAAYLHKKCIKTVGLKHIKTSTYVTIIYDVH
jgi:hypothetical protein